MSKVEFYRHSLQEEDIAAVAEVLRSIFLTTGPRTAKFEQAFAEYLGVKHVVGVMSCTAGLFLSLEAVGIAPGDEVITTPMTFIATANTILHAGAKPVFVDVEPETGNIDVAHRALHHGANQGRHAGASLRPDGRHTQAGRVVQAAQSLAAGRRGPRH